MKDNNQHKHLVWEEIDRRTLLDAHVFSVLSSRRRAADGAEAEYVLVDSPDWCNIIAPVTRNDGVACFVMARQYRQGSQTVTIEFPGGIVDPGERPQEAALRELEEETGYTAESLRLIGRVNPNPALMSNSAFTFTAIGAHKDGGQDLDENERLDAELVPTTEILDLVRPDFHVHAIMLAALDWYQRYCADGLDYDARLRQWESAASPESRRSLRRNRAC
ncbi:MAG: NUDIX hydrolase [Spirochaetia bacterium]